MSIDVKNHIIPLPSWCIHIRIEANPITLGKTLMNSLSICLGMERLLKSQIAKEGKEK